MGSFCNTKLRSPFFIILFMLLSIALSSCTSRVKRDGAPKYYIDETRIPNARPKYEPLSKYGNMKSYTVFGKRYYVMRSCKNFEEVGVASWYGTKFHARKTSSGESYNMLAMTAAHKTLPLPTYVEVTNLKNNRIIIVKVNDRGPFASNRIIDLSYVAAKKLGMIGHGTTYVKIRAIDPLSPRRPLIIARNTKIVADGRTKWQKNKQKFAKPLVLGKNKSIVQSIYLQVGAFRSRVNAEKLKQRLASLCKAPIRISISAKIKLYKVQIGPINDMATADKLSNRLRGLGIKSNRTYV